MEAGQRFDGDRRDWAMSADLAEQWGIGVRADKKREEGFE